MGYHIIKDTQSSNPTSCYVTDLDDLIRINHLTADSIVYPGEVNALPVHLQSHPILQGYLNEDKRINRRAELAFLQMAFDENYILQRIDQDPKSYARYQKIMGEHPKRSDYLLVNLPNVEIDVHCLQLEKRGNHPYFLMKKADIDSHHDSIRTINRTLKFAIFIHIDEWTISESFGMISLADVLNCEVDKGYYVIPANKLTKGFTLLQELRDQLATQKGSEELSINTPLSLFIKAMNRLRRYPAWPFYLVFIFLCSFMIYDNFPWLAEFKQEFEIIFICSLSAFLLGRQWR